MSTELAIDVIPVMRPEAVTGSKLAGRVALVTGGTRGIGRGDLPESRFSGRFDRGRLQPQHGSCRRVPTRLH